MNIEIIAELAQGFEGCIKQSKLMVRAAASAGANAAKFQLIYADELATPDYEYYELFKTLEMSDSNWSEIKELCDEHGIELILDVFGEKGLRLATQIGVNTIKLHATDINNDGFLSNIADSSISRVMIGAGGAISSEIKNAINYLSSKEIILFLGFQGYPTSMEENQISRLSIWREQYMTHKNIIFGFSDHIDPDSTSSISVPSFAVGQGAQVLEKHLTLGSCMKLEDHESAMNPDQFKEFVSCIHDLETAYGISTTDKDYGMSSSENKYRTNIRRDVVTSKDLQIGAEIIKSDIVLKRTSAKDANKNIKDMYGKILNSDIGFNKPILKKDVK